MCESKQIVPKSACLIKLSRNDGVNLTKLGPGKFSVADADGAVDRYQ